MKKLSYYLYRLGGMLVPRIPPTVGYFLCRWIAAFLYQFNTHMRRTVLMNLRRIMGPDPTDAEIKRRGQLTFETILYNYFDLFRLPSLNNDSVDQLVKVDGWKNDGSIR